MFNQKRWYWKRRTRLYIGSNELKSSFGKFKGSIFAIMFGLIIGSLVIIATSNNPIDYFRYILYFAFSSYAFNNWDNTLVWWSLYIVAGLALVVSFKTGMFNIGVPGQLLAAGSVIVAIGIRYDLSQPVTILVAFVAAILAAMLVAGLIVLLKIFFNVHEVVSSILLNWTIWYFVKWIFTTSKDLYNASQGASKPVHDNMSLIIEGYKFIIPVILAFGLVFVIWFLLKKTTAGYKFKTVGLNPFAAQYAGISKKQYAFGSFLISGALAGVMGFIYYVGFNPSLSFGVDDLPVLGFDSISVALVGQISAIGVIGSALLWGIIKSGGPIGSTGLNIPNAIGDIIFGVIIYSAACAILLSRLEPIKFMIRYSNVTFNNTRRKNANIFLKNIWSKWTKTFKVKSNYKHKHHKLKQEIKKLIKDNKKNPDETKAFKIENLKKELEQLVVTKKDNIEVLWSQIHQEYKSLNHFLYKEYNRIWKKGIFGLTNNSVQKKKELFGDKLNEYVGLRNLYDEYLYNSKQELVTKLKLLKKSNSLATKDERKKLVAHFKVDIKNKKSEFNQKFLTIINNEKQQVIAINDRLEAAKDVYKKNLKNFKIDYEKQLENANEKYKKIKNNKDFKEEELKIIKLETRKEVKAIRANYKINKQKFIYIENWGEN